MVVPTLAMAAVTYFVAAVSFVSVARTLLRRPKDGIPRDAALAFPTWWACIALYMGIQGTLTAAAAVGWVSLPVWMATRLATVPALCLGAAALTYHVAYIWTGSRASRFPVAGFYAAVCALFYYVTFGGGAELAIGAWLAELRLSPDVVPLYRIVLVAVGLPPIAGSALLLASAHRVTDAAARRRIRLVAASILLWVGSGLLARLRGDDVYAFVTLTVFGLASAFGVHVAYSEPDLADAGASRRQREFEERIRHLV